MPAVHIHLYPRKTKDADSRESLERRYEELSRLTERLAKEADHLEDKPNVSGRDRERIEQINRAINEQARERADIRKKLKTVGDEGYKHNWETTTSLSEMRTALRTWERAIEKEPKGDPHNGRLYRLRQELQALKRRMARMESRDAQPGYVHLTGGKKLTSQELAKAIIAGKIPAIHALGDPVANRIVQAHTSKDATNHLGEREYYNWQSWRAAVKAAGSTRIDGDTDIATALNAQGKGVGEWDGEKGVVYAQRTGDGLPLSPRRRAEAEVRFKERTKNMTPAQLAKEKVDWKREIERSRLAEQKGEDSKTRDAGLTEWIRFPTATYEKLEVGKNYKSGERKFTVLEKSLGDGSKSAAGIGNGTPLVKVKWKDAAGKSFMVSLTVRKDGQETTKNKTVTALSASSAVKEVKDYYKLLGYQILASVVNRTVGDAGAFEENKHPRAGNGQFGSGGGGSAGGKAKKESGPKLDPRSYDPSTSPGAVEHGGFVLKPDGSNVEIYKNRKRVGWVKGGIAEAKSKVDGSNLVKTPSGERKPTWELRAKDEAVPDAYFREMGVNAKKDGDSEAQLRIALRVIKATPAQASIALATYARARTGSLVMSDASTPYKNYAAWVQAVKNRHDSDTLMLTGDPDGRMTASVRGHMVAQWKGSKRGSEWDRQGTGTVDARDTKDMSVPSYVTERVAKMATKPTPEQVQAFAKTLKWPTPELTAAWVATRPTKDAGSINYPAHSLEEWRKGIEKNWPGATYRTVTGALIASHPDAPGKEAGRFKHREKHGWYETRSADDAGKFDENKHKREGGKFSSGGGGGKLPADVHKVNFRTPGPAAKARLEKEAPKNAEGKRVLTPSAVAALKKRFGGGKYD